MAVAAATAARARTAREPGSAALTPASTPRVAARLSIPARATLTLRLLAAGLSLPMARTVLRLLTSMTAVALAARVSRLA